MGRLTLVLLLRSLLPLLSLLSAAGAEAELVSLTGPAARERLGHGDAAQRAAAATTLGDYGAPRAAVEALTEALPTERDAMVHRAIVLALARRGDAAAVPALVEALAASGAPNRVVVAHALGSFPSDASITALVDALEQEEVRAPALRSLERIGPRAVPRLLGAARATPGSIAAVVALGEIGDQRALPALVEFLADGRVEMRTTALEAIAAMGAERAAPAVAGSLADEAEAVVRAAIVTLGAIGAPSQAPLLEEKLDAEDASLRRAAITALTRLSPAHAVPHLEALAAAGDPELGPLALDLALTLRSAVAAPLLHGLLREGSRAEEAASALAELDGGAGLAVLVHVGAEGAEGAEPPPGVIRATAVCLRRYRDVADEELVASGLRLLEAQPEPPGLLLRAVAGDPRVHDRIRLALASDDPTDRAIAAQALEVHPSDAHLAALRSAFDQERDNEAYRRMASALAAMGAAPVRPRRLVARFDDVEVGPEAMMLAAEAYPAAERWTQRRLGAAFRRALRAPEVRTRAGAAWALARAGDAGARGALARALDDPAPEVRHAAARALHALLPGEVRMDIERRIRVEEDEVVARAMLDALTVRRPFPARGLRGDQVLRVRIVTGASASGARVAVDVVLPDGRYLRTRTLPSGELLLVDLPSGTADVRVLVSDTA